MAQIKSYTDISQSKKLAEILPIESADMYYPWYIEEDGDTIESGHRISTPNVGNFTTHKVNKMILPCWSLAALLEILAKIASKIDDDGSANLSSFMGQWSVNMFDCPVEAIDNYDNPVDACVAMIKKLNELKLL